jgi:hypothetical protein
LDDPNFALDPHDALYNESVDAPIMQDDPAVEAAEQKNKLRSKVAVSLHQSTISFLLIPHTSEAASCRLEGELSIHFLGRDDTWRWSWRFSNRSFMS